MRAGTHESKVVHDNPQVHNCKRSSQIITFTISNLLRIVFIRLFTFPGRTFLFQIITTANKKRAAVRDLKLMRLQIYTIRSRSLRANLCRYVLTFRVLVSFWSFLGSSRTRGVNSCSTAYEKREKTNTCLLIEIHYSPDQDDYHWCILLNILEQCLAVRVPVSNRHFPTVFAYLGRI